MPKMQFSADLYRIAFRFVSMEETRHYLRGVFIETQGLGVRLVATDGHRMFIAYDRAGIADQSGIVCLSDAALKQCKTAKRESARQICIDGDTAKVMRDDEAVAISEKCMVDGTFPDYQRIIPKMPETSKIGIYSGQYLADFAYAATDLAKLGGYVNAPITLVAEDKHSPAIVLLSCPADKQPIAFGILMPLRQQAFTAVELPKWAQPLGGPNSEYLEQVTAA